MVQTNRTSARSGTRRTRLIAASAATALVLGLGAIGAASANSDPKPDSPTPEGFLSSLETAAAWDRAVEAFPLALPKGTAWPSTAPASLLKTNEVYEEGFVEGTTAIYWACAWEASYLAATDDESRQLSLASLSEFEKLPIIEKNFPDVDLWVKHVLAPAYEGDSTGIKQDHEAACSAYDIAEGK